MKIWYENISTSIISEISVAQVKTNYKSETKVFDKKKSHNILGDWLRRYLNPNQLIDFIIIEEQVLYFYGWQEKKFDNHDMALMLVDILHSQGIVNNATYQKIMKNQNRCLN